MDKTVTVAVPIYNVEPYLQSCVDSVLAQTYTAIEVLLVDDGSTDRSGAICDRYAAQDSRVRVLHQANSGVSAARNAAVECARGEYLLFVDSDDMLETDAIETMVQAAERSGADLVAANMRSFSEAGVLKEHVMPIRDGVLDFATADLRRIRAMMGAQLSIFCLANLYRTALIRQYGLRFEDMRKVHSEDQLFNYCYFLVMRRAAFVHRSLYRYRVRTVSLSHNLKPVELLDRRFTLVRCLRDFVTQNRLPPQKPVAYRMLGWGYFIDGCSALGDPARVVEGVRAIGKDNRRLFRQTLWSVLCGETGRAYIRVHKLSFRAALYFRWMVVLLLLGQYDRPAGTYLTSA